MRSSPPRPYAHGVQHLHHEPRASTPPNNPTNKPGLLHVGPSPLAAGCRRPYTHWPGALPPPRHSSGRDKGKADGEGGGEEEEEESEGVEEEEDNDDEDDEEKEQERE